MMGRVLLLSALCSTAFAGEVRHIAITPGLFLDGEVLETTSVGFRLKIPQGEILVPFDKVEDLKTLASEEDANSPDWTIVLAGKGERAEAAMLALGTMGGLLLHTPEEWDADTGADTAGCELDLDCISTQLAQSTDPNQWLFAATVGPDGEGLVLRTQLVPTGETRQTSLSAADGASRWVDEVHAVMGLEPNGAATREFGEQLSATLKRFRTAPRDRNRAWTPSRVAALSFIPFPGVPSLMQKDYATFGAALGTTAVLTAGWVGATGTTSTAPTEHIALGIAGAYVSSVASSQIFGHAALRRTAPMVAMMPTFDEDRIDGAAISFTWFDRRR